MKQPRQQQRQRHMHPHVQNARDAGAGAGRACLGTCGGPPAGRRPPAPGPTSCASCCRCGHTPAASCAACATPAAPAPPPPHAAPPPAPPPAPALHHVRRVSRHESQAQRRLLQGRLGQIRRLCVEGGTLAVSRSFVKASARRACSYRTAIQQPMLALDRGKNEVPRMPPSRALLRARILCKKT